MAKNKQAPNKDGAETMEHAQENQKLGKGKNISMGAFKPKNTSK